MSYRVRLAHEVEKLSSSPIPIGSLRRKLAEVRIKTTRGIKSRQCRRQMRNVFERTTKTRIVM